MKRTTILAAVFGFMSASFATLLAQGPPPADPDAKGSLSVTATVANNTSTIDVVTTNAIAQAGWVVKDVTMFAMEKTMGGYIKPGAGTKDNVDPKKYTASLPGIPNGTYFVWAIMTVQNNVDSSTQLIGSPLINGLAVNANPSAPPFVDKVSITYTDGFSRIGGGTQVIGKGRAAVSDPDWDLQMITQPVTMRTIPFQGGLVRTGIPALNPPPPNGLTYNWNMAPPGIFVPAAFEYYITTNVAIGPKPSKAGAPYTAGSPWVKK